jgi:RNA 2',3'-cyclic 3'-phosphodiesterase
MPDMWRLFIAIELPSSVLAQLADVQDQLKKRTPPRTVRWVNPDGIHLTLKFLGDVPVIKRDSLEKALAKAVEGHAPFALSTGNLGCFPNTNRPRVAWIGLQNQVEALAALRDAVERLIAPLGYPTEDRPFSPHLTLGRVRREARRDDVQKLGDLIANSPAPSAQRWQVTAISLIRSELKPSGAVYTPLFYAPLT